MIFGVGLVLKQVEDAVTQNLEEFCLGERNQALCIVMPGLEIMGESALPDNAAAGSISMYQIV